MRFYSVRDIECLPQLQNLAPDDRFAMRVVARVFPFRVNNYVVEDLIDWENVPDDPLFRLTFPQRGMLDPRDFERLSEAVRTEAPVEDVAAIVDRIRLGVNPHPAGQMMENVPSIHGEPVPGMQHKYRESVLIFPSHGQTCHTYCTYCFRWPQIAGMDGFKFATDRAGRFLTYLREHDEVTDVLITGGDPMIMSAARLAAYVEPLLGPGFEHIQTIRIGTKSLAYWPYRFVSDRDTDDVLRLFERVVDADKHLALMAHYSHWRELSTPVSKEAVRRIRSTGAEIRTQSPIVRHVNDDPGVWARMWKEQVRLGCIPYYMFVERNTGASDHFSVPLYRAWRVYRGAYQRLSGLGRTVRGPVMSAYPGKVLVEGVSEVHGERVFVLSMIQSRVADQVRRPFFARFDPDAAWLTDLVPALGSDRFPFERDARDRLGAHRHDSGSWHRKRRSRARLLSIRPTDENA
jgi:KamA family protein